MKMSGPAQKQAGARGYKAAARWAARGWGGRDPSRSTTTRAKARSLRTAVGMEAGLAEDRLAEVVGCSRCRTVVEGSIVGADGRFGCRMTFPRARSASRRTWSPFSQTQASSFASCCAQPVKVVPVFPCSRGCRCGGEYARAMKNAWRKDGRRMVDEIMQGEQHACQKMHISRICDGLIPDIFVRTPMRDDCEHLSQSVRQWECFSLSASVSRECTTDPFRLCFDPNSWT